MIDEEKLIESLRPYYDKVLYQNISDDEKLAKHDMLSDVMCEIRKQPKTGEWIPCRERLPESGKRYLVSVVWKDEDFESQRVYDAVYGSDGLWHGYDYKPLACEVIAWQLLPEEYHE